MVVAVSGAKSIGVQGAVPSDILGALQAFGKPVRIRHCPRNGKSESLSIRHWACAWEGERRMQVNASLASPETGLGFRRHVAEGDGAHLSPTCACVLSISFRPCHHAGERSRRFHENVSS